MDENKIKKLKAMLAKANVIYGSEQLSSYLAPTVIKDVKVDDQIMEEEIFAPIFPILPYQDVGEVIQYIQSKDKPLAFYLFSQDKALQDCLIDRLDFGGACINDTLTHISNPRLPFNGVGKSGIGKYHGYFGFQTFSYTKSIVKKGFFDLFLKHRPYHQKWLKYLKVMLK